jgi:hypothetical protein
LNLSNDKPGTAGKYFLMVDGDNYKPFSRKQIMAWVETLPNVEVNTAKYYNKILTNFIPV